MVTLTRLNGTSVCINVFLIIHLESTPDTMITFTNGHHLLVRESVDEVVAASVTYLSRLRQEGVDPLVAGQTGRITM
jgi:flagellar protein FlbD